MPTLSRPPQAPLKHGSDRSTCVWVNVATATVFAPVSALTAAEVERGTQVTYLGQVYGTMAALARMRVRNLGVIVNVWSALAYREVPLQAVYCGAKFAIRGFTDALRSEIIHDRLNVHLTMVNLPAVNTPQFDWALNKTGRKARPVAPIFQPEVAARAIVFAANRLALALLDRYLARTGYNGQLTDEPLPDDAPSNLFEPVSGDYGAHGRFDASSRTSSWEMWTDRHRIVFWATAGIGLLAGARMLARKWRV